MRGLPRGFTETPDGKALQAFVQHPSGAVIRLSWTRPANTHDRDWAATARRHRESLVTLGAKIIPLGEARSIDQADDALVTLHLEQPPVLSPIKDPLS